MKFSDLLNPVPDPLDQGPPGGSTKQSLNRHEVAQSNGLRSSGEPLRSPSVSRPTSPRDVGESPTEADEGGELQPSFSETSRDLQGGSPQASVYGIECPVQPRSLARQPESTAIHAEVDDRVDRHNDTDQLSRASSYHPSTDEDDSDWDMTSRKKYDLRSTASRKRRRDSESVELPETVSIIQLRRSSRRASGSETTLRLTEEDIQDFLCAYRSPPPASQISREVLPMVPPQIKVEDPTAIEADVKEEEEETRMSDIPWASGASSVRQSSGRRSSRNSLALSQSLSPTQNIEARRSDGASSSWYSSQVAS